jgi:hypothetical protein
MFAVIYTGWGKIVVGKKGIGSLPPFQIAEYCLKLAFRLLIIDLVPGHQGQGFYKLQYFVMSNIVITLN